MLDEMTPRFSCSFGGIVQSIIPTFVIINRASVMTVWMTCISVYFCCTDFEIFTTIQVTFFLEKPVIISATRFWNNRVVLYTPAWLGSLQCRDLFHWKLMVNQEKTHWSLLPMNWSFVFANLTSLSRLIHPII